MLAIAATARTSGAAVAEHKTVPNVRLRTVSLSGKVPLSFELNEGQTDEHVKFLSRRPGYTLFLTQSGAVLALRKGGNKAPVGTLTGKRGAKPEPVATQVLRVKLVGANPHAKIEGLEQLLGKANYFIGNDPKKWHTNIPTYARIRYRDVYPGIDVAYYGTGQGQLEYDFIVAPGTDPKAITFRLEGAKKLLLNGESDLVATLPDGGQLVQHLPAIYQERDRKREQLQGRVVMRGKDAIGFELAKYDRHRAIYIDPGLVYSTYLGGSRMDIGTGIGVDSEGNAYVTGTANSADFPTTSGALQTSSNAIANGNFTAFVAKLNPSSSGEASLVYSTYLGGSTDDQGMGIAVDSSGDAYVTGTTQSTDFPTTPGAFQTVNNGAGSTFVTKLNPTGSSLLYSTYLGGYEGGFIIYALGQQHGIAADTSGDAYVTGSTLAISNSSCAGDGVPFDCCTGPGTGTCIPFPTTPGAYQTVNNAPGGINVFMAKLDPSASGPASLLYSTYLGGSGGAGAGGIAVDSAGNAYLTGVAGADFPITSGAFQTVSKGAAGAVNSFVAKLNPSAAGAASLVYSTYLGGSGINYPGIETIGDKGAGIAVDSAGVAYVTGTTVSVSNASCGGKGVTSFGLYEECCTGPRTGTCIPFPTTAGVFQAVSNGHNGAHLIGMLTQAGPDVKRGPALTAYLVPIQTVINDVNLTNFGPVTTLAEAEEAVGPDQATIAKQEAQMNEAIANHPEVLKIPHVLGMSATGTFDKHNGYTGPEIAVIVDKKENVETVKKALPEKLDGFPVLVKPLDWAVDM